MFAYKSLSRFLHLHGWYYIVQFNIFERILVDVGAYKITPGCVGNPYFIRFLGKICGFMVGVEMGPETI